MANEPDDLVLGMSSEIRAKLDDMDTLKVELAALNEKFDDLHELEEKA